MPEEAIRIQYSRSSGPGGQNVNKLNTRAELWISVSSLWMLPDHILLRLRSLAGRRITKEDEIHLVSQMQRSQEGNRQAVIDRLSELIHEALNAPKPRRATRPSRAAKRRRVEAKRRRAETKTHRKEVRE